MLNKAFLTVAQEFAKKSLANRIVLFLFFEISASRELFSDVKSNFASENLPPEENARKVLENAIKNATLSGRLDSRARRGRDSLRDP